MTTTPGIADVPPARTLLSGLVMVESARWHDGRLWFAHWGAGEVVAVDLAGRSEVMAPGPRRMGWSIEWLSDGTLLTTGDAITRHEPGGAVVHREQGANEIAVDPRGHVYVDGADFDFLGGGVPEPGWIDLITHDGYSRRLADGIEFPNGMVVIRTAPPSSSPVVRGTPVRLRIGDDGSLGGRRVWAEGLGPDGIGIDAEGGIWVQTADTAAHTGDPRSPAGACVRLLDGGEITHGVETDLPCFSCVLGGREGRDLFLLCNEFEGVHRLTAVQQRRSARILVTDAPCPGAR